MGLIKPKNRKKLNPLSKARAILVCGSLIKIFGSRIFNKIVLFLDGIGCTRLDRL